jgi:hypothetical protein
LQDFRSTQSCYFHLMSSGGTLYDARFATDGSALWLYRRDLTTGAATDVAAFTEAAPTQYETTYRFAIDQGVFYIARPRIADGQIEIYSYNLNQANPAIEDVFLDKTTGMDILINLDVDDGRIMLASQNGRILLLDTARRTQQLLNLGVNIGSIAQVIVK